MRWARYVEYMEAYRVLVGKPKGKNHLEDIGINGRIIITLI